MHTPVLKFVDEGHKYVSINTEMPIDWISATTLISKFHEKFDDIKMSELCSKKKTSKWYGMEPELIRSIWNAENQRSTYEGGLYHNNEESKSLNIDHVLIPDAGKELRIFKNEVNDGEKFSPCQKLEDGFYPEHFVYLESKGVCGQSDETYVFDGYIHINDFKTNKVLEDKSYVDWQGSSKMMYAPFNHLQDCNLVHYTIQMSIYMYIMLQHNPHLKPGRITIEHITFKKLGENEYGYPITEFDSNGIPVVENKELIQLPYLKKEMHVLFKNLNYFLKK